MSEPIHPRVIAAITSFPLFRTTELGMDTKIFRLSPQEAESIAETVLAAAVEVLPDDTVRQLTCHGLEDRLMQSEREALDAGCETGEVARAIDNSRQVAIRNGRFLLIATLGRGRAT